MRQAIVSVVIPTYNQARYLPQAIESVLSQSYTDLEVIVVNDGSTDDTNEVISSYKDDRLLVVNQSNRGRPAARNTGLASASGSFICFLDSDDAYCPDKLEAQIEHFNGNPQLAVSYGGNIVIDPDGNRFWFSSAEPHVELKDLLLGFPFNINDVMIRREWIERLGGFDDSHRLHGEDQPFFADLALEGAQFAGIPRFLTLRRLYPNRRFSDIPSRLSSMMRGLERGFEGLRASEQSEHIEAQALAELFLGWSIQAYAQSEPDIGSTYLLEATRLNPSLTEMSGLPVCRQLVWATVRSVSDQSVSLPNFFSHLPPKMDWLRDREVWCYGYCHFLLGTSHIIWNRPDSARPHFQESKALGFVPDETALNRLIADLLNLRLYLGADEHQRAQQEIEPVLKELGGMAAVRHVRGRLAFNRALLNYHDRGYDEALRDATRTLAADPSFVLNRGLISVTARSAWHIVKNGANGQAMK